MKVREQFLLHLQNLAQSKFQIKYENEIIGSQKNKINVYEDDLKDIFDSRTFCL